MKQNGDLVTFLRRKDYIMLNNDLGGGAFGKTVLLKDSYIDELFVAKMYKPRYEWIKEKFYAKFFHLCGCNMARSGNKATEI